MRAIDTLSASARSSRPNSCSLRGRLECRLAFSQYVPPTKSHRELMVQFSCCSIRMALAVYRQAPGTHFRGFKQVNDARRESISRIHNQTRHRHRHHILKCIRYLLVHCSLTALVLALDCNCPLATWNDHKDIHPSILADNRLAERHLTVNFNPSIPKSAYDIGRNSVCVLCTRHDAMSSIVGNTSCGPAIVSTHSTTGSISGSPIASLKRLRVTSQASRHKSLPRNEQPC